MHCPPVIKCKKGQVLEIYKQASRRFYDKLQKILKGAGYRPTKSDPCLYRRVSKRGHETLISVVVDDLLIASERQKN